MKASIYITVGSAGFQNTYEVGETRAPKAYDYHGVIQIEEGDDARIVAIPVDDLEVQTARYLSGLYAFKPFAEAGEYLAVDENVLIDLLVARLLK